MTMTASSSEGEEFIYTDNSRSGLGGWLTELQPATIKVDERDSVDRLSFAASYGRLINFYDKHNNKNGSWRNFFLKDPLILLATISRSDYKVIHLQCIQLEKTFKRLFESCPTSTLQIDLCRVLNQLFFLVNNIFCNINEWLQHLHKDPKSYPLKEFIILKVETLVADLLRESLAQQLILSAQFEEIEGPDQGVFNYFESCWQINICPSDTGNKVGGSLPLNFARLQQAWYAEYKIYQTLFNFYVQVIDNSKQAYTLQTQQGSHYPDTALLITFAELMSVQQQQLNNMTGKHLDFYYKDVLKQSSQKAVADEVYLCFRLAKKIPNYTLIAGTEFDGGVDNKSPVRFASMTTQKLNKILIAQAHTVFYRDNKLYLQEINKADEVKKNPQGEMQGWPLFGDDEDKKNEIKQGFSFASPLLYLQGGVRQITISFEFFASPSLSIVSIIKEFDQADIFLSSAKKWIKISPLSIKNKFKKNTLEMQISLSGDEPAIEAFVNNPDAYESPWPLFKLLSNDMGNFIKVPDLKSISIKTVVSEFKDLALYSDSGKLAGNDFLPFGPIVECGDSFYIGSQEIFSKPTSELLISINWMQLPVNFSQYYSAYNCYLDNYSATVSSSNFSNDCFRVVFSILKGTQWQTVLPQGEESSAQPSQLFQVKPDKGESDTLNPISSFSFKGNISSGLNDNDSVATIVPAKPELLLEILKGPGNNSNGLLKIQLDSPKLGFGHNLYAKVITQTTLENASLLVKHSKQSVTISLISKVISLLKAFFTKINNLLKKVVSTVGKLISTVIKVISSALKKVLGYFFKIASKIKNIFHKKGKEKSEGIEHEVLTKILDDVKKEELSILNKIESISNEFNSMPNLPYAPKVSSLSINYTASDTVYFSKADPDNYPFEFYHYDGFSCFPIYNSQTDKALTQLNSSQQIPGQVQSSNSGALRLFAGGPQGALYLGLDNVIAPCELSIFFQLAHSPSKENSVLPAVEFSYLSLTGWQLLPILSDTTQKFACSGIVNVKIPEDITRTSVLMPDSQYWLAVSVQQQQNVLDFAQIVYMNTQAVKASRFDLNELAAGQCPTLVSGKITKTTVPQVYLSSVIQPFSSEEGSAEEDQTHFYHRVSQRLKVKDRSLSLDDYEKMAFLAYPGLYFSHCSKGHNPGQINLALVNAYADSAMPDSFYPVVNAGDIKKISDYLKARSSTFVRLNVENMKQQMLTVNAQLEFCDALSANLYCQKIEQQLKLYLSPWISTNQTQVQICQGISEAQVFNFLISRPEVTGVHGLTLHKSGDLTDEVILLVSAKTHNISEYIPNKMCSDEKVSA